MESCEPIPLAGAKATSDLGQVYEDGTAALPGRLQEFSARLQKFARRRWRRDKRRGHLLLDRLKFRVRPGGQQELPHHGVLRNVCLADCTLGEVIYGDVNRHTHTQHAHYTDKRLYFHKFIVFKFTSNNKKWDYFSPSAVTFLGADFLADRPLKPFLKTRCTIFR